MTTHFYSLSRDRRSLPITLFVMIFASTVATGCATQGSAEVKSTDPVVVEVSDQFIGVRNQTGSALVNVSIVILPAQGSPFTKMVARVENQQRHQVAAKDLKTSQGVSFNPVFAQPQKVLVSAANLSGQRYEASVPWR